MRTPTDITGQHIHLPKWDLTTADGAANGWNYEDGTLSPGAVVERIHAMAASGTGYVAFTDAASMARVTGELQRSKIQILRDCDDVVYEGAPDLPPAMLADIQANNAMLDAMWRPGFGQS